VPQQKISGTWLALPAALIVAVAVLGPLTWFLVARRRERSAYREYLERTNAA
jgi:predicted LPLAT superfamily acyltransferase